MWTRDSGAIAFCLPPSIRGSSSSQPDQMRTFYERLVEQMRAQPGVASVGLTRYVPLGVTNGSLGITIDGALAA